MTRGFPHEFTRKLTCFFLESFDNRRQRELFPFISLPSETKISVNYSVVLNLWVHWDIGSFLVTPYHNMTIARPARLKRVGHKLRQTNRSILCRRKEPAGGISLPTPPRKGLECVRCLVHTKELVWTLSVWPALVWTCKHERMTGEKREKMTNGISV